MKRAAVTGLAFQPYPASHQFHELGRDGQAEARAAVATRRGVVGLLKRFEDQMLLVGGDANARIVYTELNRDRVVFDFGGRNAEHDFAMFGEFDRIADEINDNLS